MGRGRQAFHIGLFDNYSFTNRFGLQVEGLFSVQGFGLRAQETGTPR
ncbi:MAG: hypothetical protein LBS79_07620 [Tannerella sp.]|nr:hypothetical protein [Tannerella sp.]